MKRMHPLATGLALSVFLMTALPVQGRDDRKNTSKSKGTVEASRSVKFRLGGISIGGGYARFSGHRRGLAYYPYYDPFFWPYHGFYAPSFYYPPFYGFHDGPGSGEIRLTVNDESALVYIDGALAGKAGDLKKFSLEPGVYSLRVESSGREPHELRVYVLSGKTLKINAELAELGKEPKP